MSDACIVISDDEEDEIPPSQASSNGTGQTTRKTDYGDRSSWLHDRNDTQLPTVFGLPSTSPWKRKLAENSDGRRAKVSKSNRNPDIRKYLSPPKEKSTGVIDDLDDDELPDLDPPRATKPAEKEEAPSPVFPSNRRKRLSLSWRKNNGSPSQSAGSTQSPLLTRRNIEQSYNTFKASQTQRYSPSPVSGSPNRATDEKSSWDGNKGNEGSRSVKQIDENVNDTVNVSSRSNTLDVHVIAETSSEDELEASQAFCDPVVISPEQFKVPSLHPLTSAKSADDDETANDEVNLLPVTTESDSDDDIPILELPTRSKRHATGSIPVLDLPAKPQRHATGNIPVLDLAVKPQSYGTGDTPVLDLPSKPQRHGTGDIPMLDLPPKPQRHRTDDMPSLDLPVKLKDTPINYGKLEQHELQAMADDMDFDMGSETQDLSKDQDLGSETEDEGLIESQVIDDLSDVGSETQDLSKEEFVAEVPDDCSSPTRQSRDSRSPVSGTAKDKSSLSVKSVQNSGAKTSDKTGDVSDSPEDKFDFSQLTLEFAKAVSQFHSGADTSEQSKSKYFQSTSKAKRDIGATANSDEAKESTQSKYFQQTHKGVKRFHSDVAKDSSESSDEDDNISSNRRTNKLESKTGQIDSSNVPRALQPILRLVDVIKSDQWNPKRIHNSPKKDQISDDTTKTHNVEDDNLNRSLSPIKKDDQDTSVITIDSSDLFSGDEAPVFHDSDEEELLMTLTQKRSPPKVIAGPDVDCLAKDSRESAPQRHVEMSWQERASKILDESSKKSDDAKFDGQSKNSDHPQNNVQKSNDVDVDKGKAGALNGSSNDDKMRSKDDWPDLSNESKKSAGGSAADDLDAYHELENFTLLEDDIVCLDDSDEENDMFANLTQIDVDDRHENKDKELPDDHVGWHDDEDGVILIEDDLESDLPTFDLKKVKTEIQNGWWDEDIFSQAIDVDDVGCDNQLPDIKDEEPLVIEPNSMFNNTQDYVNDVGKDKTGVKMETSLDFEIPDEMNTSWDEDLPDFPVKTERTEESTAKEIKVNHDAEKEISKIGNNRSEHDKHEARSNLFERLFSKNLEKLNAEEDKKLASKLDADSDDDDETLRSVLNVYDVAGPSFDKPPKKVVTPKSKYFERSNSLTGSSQSPKSVARTESPSQKLAQMYLKKAKESPKKSNSLTRKTIMLSPIKKRRFYGKKSPESSTCSKIQSENRSSAGRSIDFEITAPKVKPRQETLQPYLEITAPTVKPRQSAIQPYLSAKKTSSTSSARASHPTVGTEKKVVHLGKARKVKTGPRKKPDESFSLTQAIGKARAAMASRDKKTMKDDESPEKLPRNESTEEPSIKRTEHHKKNRSSKDDRSREKKDSKSSSRSKDSVESSRKDKDRSRSDSRSRSSSKSSHHSSSSSSSKSHSKSDSDKKSDHRSSKPSSGTSVRSTDSKEKSKASNDNENAQTKSKSESKSSSSYENVQTKSKSDSKSSSSNENAQTKSKSDSKSSSSSKSSHSHSRSSGKSGSHSGSSGSSKSDSKSKHSSSSRSDKNSHKSKGSKDSSNRSKENEKRTSKKTFDEMSLLSQIIHDQDNLMTKDPDIEKHAAAKEKEKEKGKEQAPSGKDGRESGSSAAKDDSNKSSSSTAKEDSNKSSSNTSPSVSSSVVASSNEPQGAPAVSTTATEPQEFIKSLRGAIAQSNSKVPASSSSVSSRPNASRNVGADGFAVPLPPAPRGPISRPVLSNLQTGATRVPPRYHGAVQNGAKDARDRQAVTSVSLTEDSILRMILSWNPAWLPEQIKFGAKSKPPPLLEVVKCKELYGEQAPTLFPLLTHGYECLRDYFKIMLPLMLHEIWAQVFNEFCEKSRRYGGPPSFQAILCQALDRNEHVCEVMFQAIITARQIEERKRPMEGMLMIVKLTSVGKENSQKNTQLLALTTRVERSQRTHPVLANNPKSKEHGASIWNVALKFAPKKNIRFEDNQIVVLESLNSIVTTHRHIRALLNLGQIPSTLCRVLLRPTADKNALIHKPPPGFKSQVTKGQYNASQSNVIAAVSNAILQPYIIPKICLIQGPPGTGKSHTILGIIKETLRGVPAEGGKVHILLTAPSNAAVDELVKKLVKDDEKAFRAGSQRRVNFIRMGTMSHPAVQEYSLENKAKKLCEEKFKQQNLPLSVQEELRRLEGNLQDLAMRRRAAVQSGRSSEVVSCEREERNVKKKKDQIEAAYQTSGKQQLTFSEKKQVEMQLLMNSDVVCTTLNSCGLRILMELNSKRPRYPFFNAVIVDEACQSTEIDNLIPLQFKCTKLVLVGDPRQLPATVISKVAENLDYNQSLFERLEKSCGSDNPVLMLDTQYRMHSEICHFPSQHIYEGRLKTDLITSSQRESSPYVPYKVFDLVDGQEVGSDFGFWNPTELDFICRLCSFLMRGKSENYAQGIGIISPYKAQSTRLLKALRDRRMAIEASTVDGFQGREKDIIIVTCVRANSDTGGIGFLSDVRRMNVALTRARYACYVVGHLQSLKVNRDWRHLIADAETRKVTTRVTNTMNIVDVLNKQIMKSRK